jgi:hypothetical protein
MTRIISYDSYQTEQSVEVHMDLAAKFDRQEFQVGVQPLLKFLVPTCSPTLLQSGSENRAWCPVTSALLELRGDTLPREL